MPVNRRNFLKLAGLSMGGALLPKEISKPKLTGDPEKSMGMLYDATKCIGCRACQVACKKQNNLPAELDEEGLHDAPTKLTSNTWTIIQLYESEDGSEYSFVKKQCMHCVEPACVAVCPVGAMQKTDEGPVIYEDYKCFGCRYCMAACPFDVPKYQWEKALPLIQKCNFCADRQTEGKEPACSSACPAGALVFGKRTDLLAEAKARIAAEPDRYVNHVYGETEVGGTSKLYLSAVAFDKLGFPTLTEEKPTEAEWPYLSFVPWQILLVGSLMTGTYLWTHRNEKKSKKEGKE